MEQQPEKLLSADEVKATLSPHMKSVWDAAVKCLYASTDENLAEFEKLCRPAEIIVLLRYYAESVASETNVKARTQKCASLLESPYQHSVRVHVGSAIRVEGDLCVTSVDETDGVSSVTVRNGDLVFLKAREILDADGDNLACECGKLLRIDVHGNSISSTNVKVVAPLPAGADVETGGEA